MTAPSAPYQWPYPTTPGASMPPPSTTPAAGIADMWGYFWLTLVNTLIIAVAGLTAWFYVHPGI